jgi:DNA-binding CsgD family transcriptional regulator
MANEYLLNIAASLQGEADKIRALAVADGEVEPALDRTRDFAIITENELGTFNLVAQGWTSKEIAHTWGISIRSVDNLRYSLQEKIRAKNTSHAVALLYQAKLLR